MQIVRQCLQPFTHINSHSSNKSETPARASRDYVPTDELKPITKGHNMKKVFAAIGLVVLVPVLAVSASFLFLSLHFGGIKQ